MTGSNQNNIQTVSGFLIHQSKLVIPQLILQNPGRLLIYHGQKEQKRYHRNKMGKSLFHSWFQYIILSKY